MVLMFFDISSGQVYFGAMACIPCIMCYALCRWVGELVGLMHVKYEVKNLNVMFIRSWTLSLLEYINCKTILWRLYVFDNHELINKTYVEQQATAIDMLSADNKTAYDICFHVVDKTCSVS